jgi:hypothetical protein
MEEAWGGPIITIDTPTSLVEEYATQRQRYKRGNGVINSRIDRKNSPIVTEMHGFYGEFVIAQYYSELLGDSIEVDLRHTIAGDGGVDFENINGYSVDGKFSAYPDGDLYFTTVHHFKADIAMLVVPIDRDFMKEEYPSFRIAGWIEQESFFENHIYHDPPPLGERKTTWQGAGRTQTSIPKHCLRCEYHANPLNPIKPLKSTESTAINAEYQLLMDL